MIFRLLTKFINNYFSFISLSLSILIENLTNHCYKKALFIEFQNLALNCESDKALKIEYKGEKIGEFNVDILVEQKVLVMLISQEKIIQKHEIQLSNQLKNSEIEVGLLLNFFIEGEHKRKYYSNSLKRTDST